MRNLLHVNIRLAVLVIVFNVSVLHAQNVWTGTWSLGAPTAGQNIEIQADIGWSDLNGVSSFGDWTHTSGAMTWQGTSGLTMNNVVMNGGTWKHAANSTTAAGKQHDINLTASSFTLNSGATIDAIGQGYSGGQGPGAGSTGGYGSGAGHGGHGGQGYDGTPGDAYGSINAPVTLGSGGTQSGGGAIQLNVSGAVVIDGAIAADAAPANDTRRSGNAGGSVFITGGTISGSGTVSANGSGGGHGRPGMGSGGRIALVQTSGTTSYSDLTTSGLTVAAFSGAANIRAGGAGTVYVENAGNTASQGEVVIDNGTRFNNLFHQLASVRATPINGTFSQITTQNMGIASVESGATVTVNGAILSDADDASDGIALRGGTLSTSSGTLTIADWALYADAGSTQTFNGNIVVADGGQITHTSNSPDTDFGTYVHDSYRMDLTVNGNVDVLSGGAINADNKGFGGFGSEGRFGPSYSTGGQYGSGASFGGMGAQGVYGAPGPYTYGSILAPELPGSSSNVGAGVMYPSAGGVIKLTVNGDLTVDGSISADSVITGFRVPGVSGGSVFITADTVTGTTGMISANGSGGNHGYPGQGGGGRVALHLTGSDAVGSGVAVGAYGGARNARVGAAGTVYIEGQSTAAGAGIVYVDNNGNINTGSPSVPVTLLPPNYDDSNADYPFPEYGYYDDLSNTTLVLGDAANLALSGDLTLAGVQLAPGTTLDLAGYTLTLLSFTDTNGDVWAEKGIYTNNLTGMFDGVSFNGGALVNPIPEPASFVLFALSGLLMMRRRRRGSC